MSRQSTISPVRDCLVAVVTSDADLQRYCDDCWYRIPERAIGRVISADALTDSRWLALYQSGSISVALPGAIELCAPVLAVEQRSRLELIPDEPAHPFAHERYRVMRVGRPERLRRPIAARRPRRVTFVRTSHEILHAASDLNDLFIGSPAEELLWQSLRSLDVERRCFMRVADTLVEVDFAVFQGERVVGILCDDSAQGGEVREPSRWGLLRFSPARIEADLAGCLDEIMECVRGIRGQPAASARRP